MKIRVGGGLMKKTAGKIVLGGKYRDKDKRMSRVVRVLPNQRATGSHFVCENLETGRKTTISRELLLTRFAPVA